MEKYEFKKIDLDNYELIYDYKHIDLNTKEEVTEKIVLPFKRTVGLAKKLQSLDFDARLKMFEYLKENGKTKNDFITQKTDENGKVIIDESNYKEFEKQFMQREQYRLAEEIYSEILGKSLTQIIMEIGLNTNNDIAMLGIKLRAILMGEEQIITPSTSGK